jgi:hypothetical protein
MRRPRRDSSSKTRCVGRAHAATRVIGLRDRDPWPLDDGDVRRPTQESNLERIA